MKEEERQRSAKQSTDTSARIPNVPDPDEDDLDDLDGMTGTLLKTCGALYLLF